MEPGWSRQAKHSNKDVAYIDHAQTADTPGSSVRFVVGGRKRMQVQQDVTPVDGRDLITS